MSDIDIIHHLAAAMIVERMNAYAGEAATSRAA
jgi:hypothetical protein